MPKSPNSDLVIPRQEAQAMGGALQILFAGPLGTMGESLLNLWENPETLGALRPYLDELFDAYYATNALINRLQWRRETRIRDFSGGEMMVFSDDWLFDPPSLTPSSTVYIEGIKAQKILRGLQHELNTPLTGLEGFANLAMKRSGAPQLAEVHGEARRMKGELALMLDSDRDIIAIETDHRIRVAMGFAQNPRLRAA